VLQRDGVIDRIGADQVHGNIYRAVEAQLAADGKGLFRP
jgi:SulP family sulfate permease